MVERETSAAVAAADEGVAEDPTRGGNRPLHSAATLRFEIRASSTAMTFGSRTSGRYGFDAHMGGTERMRARLTDLMRQFGLICSHANIAPSTDGAIIATHLFGGAPRQSSLWEGP